jgi:glycosyltransferase involved in cell wall biosynthesis
MPYSIVHTESSVGWGGQEIRVLRESKAFLDRGHQVTVLAPAQAEIAKRAVDFGVPVCQVPILHRNFRAFWSLRKALKRLNPDLVNTHSSTDSWLVAAVCLSMRRPPKVVRTRHICSQPSRSVTTRWLYHKAAQKVVTTGEAIRAQILKIGIPADHVVSIPTGINPDSYLPGSKNEAKSLLGLSGLTVIGVVATIRSWKGHRVLIEALKHLPASEYRLLFVGDGPIRLALEEELQAAGLGDLVLFSGHQNDVLPWLQAMDIFVLPSYANEGISQALVQAMMAGIPVVTTTAGAITEVAKDGVTALVVEPNDPQALRTAVTTVLDDPQLARKLALSARQFVLENHSEVVMVQSMDAVFQDLQVLRGKR